MKKILLFLITALFTLSCGADNSNPSSPLKELTETEKKESFLQSVMLSEVTISGTKLEFSLDGETLTRTVDSTSTANYRFDSVVSATESIYKKTTGRIRTAAPPEYIGVKRGDEGLIIAEATTTAEEIDYTGKTETKFDKGKEPVNTTQQFLNSVKGKKITPPVDDPNSSETREYKFNSDGRSFSEGSDTANFHSVISATEGIYTFRDDKILYYAGVKSSADGLTLGLGESLSDVEYEGEEYPFVE